MKERKKIDRIFQERLKDFEATPSNAVWDNINEALHGKKDDRKIIPIWWKFAGIAASLLLMIIIGNSVFNTNPNQDINNEVVNTTEDSDTLLENNSTVDTEQKNDIDELNNKLVPDEINNSQVTDSGTINKTHNTTNSASNSSIYKEYSDENKAVVTTNNKSNDNTKRLLNTTNKKQIGVNSDAVIVEQNSIYKSNTPENKLQNIVADNIPKNLPEQPAQKQNKVEDVNSLPANTSLTDGVAITNSTEKIENEKEINSITEDLKPSIEDALASSEDGEDYDEKEKEVINRWSVTPNVSPVYYNTLGKGSSINSQFNNNSKSGQINMAYGLNASYAINEKLSVRSGVNNVNIGYNTNDVVVYNALGAEPSFVVGVPNSSTEIQNLNLNVNVQNVSMLSGRNLVVSEMPNIIVENANSSINQEISFIEIPLELEYKLSDKKIGVNLIGGFSTMLLNQNKIYADIGDERMLLGEANNINNVSYSANIGVGLGVKVTRKMSLNFEPTFKYQIKTFENTSGDFNPYILGVNTGLKFKF